MMMMSLGHFSLEFFFFLPHPKGRGAWGTCRTSYRDQIFNLAWEFLGTLQEELEIISSARECRVPSFACCHCSVVSRKKKKDWICKMCNCPLPMIRENILSVAFFQSASALIDKSIHKDVFVLLELETDGCHLGELVFQRDKLSCGMTGTCQGYWHCTAHSQAHNYRFRPSA